MWFRKKLIDDQTAATMHWLGQRGIVARPGVSPEQWAKAATDSTDYQCLMAAHKKGPCATFELCFIDRDAPLDQRVHAMADALQLPIDEVKATDPLQVRSGPSWDSYDITSDVLIQVARSFVDPMHTILSSGPYLVLIHRDVEEEARTLLSTLTGSSVDA